LFLDNAFMLQKELKDNLYQSTLFYKSNCFSIAFDIIILLTYIYCINIKGGRVALWINRGWDDIGS